MQKLHAWPQGHWNWPIQVTHKHGVRCGDMLWVGGQVNLSPDGEVLNPGDLSTQTACVIENFAAVLNELGGDLDDLVFLNCFYVNNGDIDEKYFLDLIADALPDSVRTAVTTIPVPYLAYDEMLVEIDGVAMRNSGGEKIPRTYIDLSSGIPTSEKFCSAIRCGKMIFVSAQSAENTDGTVEGSGNILQQSNVLTSRLEQALASFGAGFKDVVKNNRWYAGGDTLQDFEPAALAYASNFPEPGPAATGIPIPRHANPDVLIKIGVIAMLGEGGEYLPRRHVWPETLWDWHVHLPYKHGLKCEDMIFLGGQVSLDKKGVATNPGELTPQTHQAMAHIKTILNELGADYDDVCKVMTLYMGSCGAEALHSNLPIRSSYFSDPGPATTGVPLPVLAYENMMIEIDIYAMAEPD